MPASYTLSQHDRLDDIMDEIGHGRFHVIAVIGLGCRIFVRGSVMSLTAILEPYFKCKFNQSYFAASFYVTAHLLSGAFTSPLTGWLANRYGKRNIMFLFSSMAVVTSLLHVMSSSFLMVAITMGCYGLFENAQFLVYPYLLEIFCKSGRKHISIVELFYVAGWASGVLSGYFCLKYSSWQWSIIICVIIPLIPVIITLGHIPESPRYLLANGDKIGTIKSLVEISLMNNPGADKADLIRKYTNVLFDVSNDRKDDDDDDDESFSSSPAEDPPSNDDVSSEESSLLIDTDLKITNKDLWHRITIVCIIAFTISATRNAFVYASAQRYGKDFSKEHCNQCSPFVSTNRSISVIVGLTIAVFVSYNFIGRLKRRLALRGLITALAIAMLPFYLHLNDWLLACFFFIASVINECLLIVRLVYCTEVVRSSVRGFANNLMFAFAYGGNLVGAFMVTYALHVSPFLTFMSLHIYVLIGLVVIYRYVIETKDMSLN